MDCNTEKNLLQCCNNRSLAGYIILSMAALAFALGLIPAYLLNKDGEQSKYTDRLGQPPMDAYVIITVIIAILGIWLIITGNKEESSPPPPPPPPPQHEDETFCCCCCEM